MMQQQRGPESEDMQAKGKFLNIQTAKMNALNQLSRLNVRFEVVKEIQ
jgi:hypothetical protein